MGVYNLNFTGAMPPLVVGGTIHFYENISSLVDIANTKNLIALCRARKTNITRFVSCNPAGGSGDTDNPVYNSNDRYWQFGISFFWAAYHAVYDVYGYRLLSTVVMPTQDIIDIDLYYADSNTLAIASLTKIEGTNIVVNLTVDETYSFLNVPTNSPLSYYTEYTDNDVADVIPGSTGEPGVADEELNAQYGTQIWQV